MFGLPFGFLVREKLKTWSGKTKEKSRNFYIENCVWTLFEISINNLMYI